jgi:hypothetical protein
MRRDVQIITWGPEPSAPPRGAVSDPMENKTVAKAASQLNESIKNNKDDRANWVKSSDMALAVLNTIVLVLLGVLSLDMFNRQPYMSVYNTTDAAFASEAALVGDTVRVAVVPNASMAVASACPRASRACAVGELKYLVAGSSGLLRADEPGVPEPAFDGLHLLWSSSWFATPLSLLILGNTRADRMRPWMWFVLFGIIAIWNIVGLLLMYFLHPVPLYNIIYASASFVFSSLCVFALREVYRAATDDAKYAKTFLGKDAAEASATSFMRLRPDIPIKYDLVASTPNEEALPSHDVPQYELSQTYSSLTVVLLQYFFVLPAMVAILFMFIQQRPMPVLLQQMYWSTSFFVSSVVLLQRCTYLHLSLVCDAAFLLLAVTAALTFFYNFLPQLTLAFAADQDKLHIIVPLVMVLVLAIVLVLGILGDLGATSLAPPKSSSRKLYHSYFGGGMNAVASLALSTTVGIWAWAVTDHQFCVNVLRTS